MEILIRVTVELLPHGDATRARHLGSATIANVGTGSHEIGNYRVELSKWGRPSTAWRVGTIEGFPRLKLGPWDLLMWALLATVGARSTKKNNPALSVEGDGVRDGRVDDDDKNLRWQADH